MLSVQLVLFYDMQLQNTGRMPLDLKFFYFAGGAVFDASQYAFFGKNVVEEVELGGLEDEDGGLPPVDLNEEEFFFNVNREEVSYQPMQNF